MNAGLDFVSGSAKALNFGPNFQSSSQKFSSNFSSGPNFGITTREELGSSAMDPEPKHSPMDLEAGKSFSFILDDNTLFVLAGLGSPINADGADMTRWRTGRVRHCFE